MAELVSFKLDSLPSHCCQKVKLSVVVPDQEYNWTISMDGRLHLTWLRKFSHYQEDNPVDISWVTSSEEGRANGTSRLVTIPSLSLGLTYTATLMDLKDEDKLTTFTFTACE